MDTQTLANELLSEAENRAQSQGVRFGEGAEDFMRAHALNAATEIIQSPRHDKEEAVFAFHKLVDEMIKQSDEIPGYKATRPGIIGEQTLDRALSRLCPLWPFC